MAELAEPLDAAPGGRDESGVRAGSVSTGSGDGAKAAFLRDATHARRGPRRHPGLRLNWLRAAALGANDGIVSTAGLVVGVAGATDDRSALLTAGLAGLLAGSMSMAAGEYVSVSTQLDSEKAARAGATRTERTAGRRTPGVHPLEQRGLTRDVAREAAEQLTERDALKAHARVELGIDPDALTNPWHAAWASFLSFTVGALLPLLAIAVTGGLAPGRHRALGVLGALVLTGWLSARLGSANPGRAVLRNVVGGALAMGVTDAVVLLGRPGDDERPAGHLTSIGPDLSASLAEITNKQSAYPRNTCG